MPLSDRFVFDVDGLSAQLRVGSFEGTEGISELFRFELLVLSEESAIDFDEVLGKAALLTIHSDVEDEPRHVHGIVARFEMLQLGKKLTEYRATVVPRPYRLQHRRDVRIFQELTAPEVIQKVFEGAGLVSGTDFRLGLQGTYVTREYCVQHRESDWDFVSRLMEEEGIFYFFEHQADKHVLVLADRPAIHAPIAGTSALVYRRDLGAMGSVTAGTSFITRLDYAEEIRPGKTAMRDFNFKKPALKLESVQSAPAFADLELYDQPGDYVLPATGDSLAKIRLEAEQVLRKTASGTSGCPRLVSGATFTLSEHPRESLDRDWLVTRVGHRGVEPSSMEQSDSGGYSNQFELVPNDVPFRPQRITPRPMVRGVQTAIVVGPAGEEIYTDEHGRVKVQFHWDRLGKKDDKSSCWIRVSQIWAGEGWGSMFIPRINQEVVVTFEEGNPDRPLIVGRVYHGTNVPPYALPANKTRSTIKSNSSPGGDGSNELRFEDKKGSEEVYLHAQKDHTIAVEHDENKTVGHDQTLKVGNDRTKQIDHDQTATIGNDDTITVKHDRVETIDNDETVNVKHDRATKIDHDHTQSVGNDESLDVGGDRSLGVTGGQTTDIGKDHALTVGGGQTIHVKKAVTQTFDDALVFKLAKDRTETISGATKLEITKDDETKIGGKHTLEITGDSAEKVSGKKKMVFEQELTIEVGQAKITLKADGTIELQGVKIEIIGSGPLKVKGATLELKSDATAKIEAAAKIDVKAAMVDLNGSGMVKVGGGMVGVG